MRWSSGAVPERWGQPATGIFDSVVNVPSAGLYILEAIGPAASGSAVTVDFDKSVLAQMVLFALLVLVLKPLLFDPVLKVFVLREQRTEGARAEARELDERAGEILRKYEAELALVHKVVGEERDRIRADTAKLEARILEEARHAAAEIVTEGRRRIEAESNRIQFELGREAERSAQVIARQALGREVS
jgi:F-type H+-transporting ATPase subunit b